MRLILSFFIALSFTNSGFGQETSIKMKNISDTVLRDQRKLIITSDSLDAMKVMLKLFPGKLYNLDQGWNIFISWECKTCKPAPYMDANADQSQQFPYSDGVVTRLIDVINYKDTKGNEFKILGFNHTPIYDGDEDRSHGTTGLLGLAKFAKTNGSWQMRSFQPAVAAFGSWGRCPAPVPFIIGEDQFALTFENIFEITGGPSLSKFYLIAGSNGRYRQILSVDQYGQEGKYIENNEKEFTNWKSTFNIDKDSKKQYYKDILITTNGKYYKPKSRMDNSAPDDIASFIKNKKSLRFVIEKRYAFDGKQYLLKGKPVVTITNAK